MSTTLCLLLLINNSYSFTVKFQVGATQLYFAQWALYFCSLLQGFSGLNFLTLLIWRVVNFRFFSVVKCEKLGQNSQRKCSLHKRLPHHCHQVSLRFQQSQILKSKCCTQIVLHTFLVKLIQKAFKFVSSSTPTGNTIIIVFCLSPLQREGKGRC